MTNTSIDCSSQWEDRRELISPQNYHRQAQYDDKHDNNKHVKLHVSHVDQHPALSREMPRIIGSSTSSRVFHSMRSDVQNEGRTDYDQGGNVLKFTPKGFHQEITIHFKQSCNTLAACRICKQASKTRESCRNQKRHHDLPWTNLLICIVVDDSCLINDGNNDGHDANEDYQKNVSNSGLRFAEDRAISTHIIPYQQFEMKESSFDPKDAPHVCARCKGKNYTRSYCRGQKKHRQLPWNTHFVVMSADPHSSTCKTNKLKRGVDALYGKRCDEVGPDVGAKNDGNGGAKINPPTNSGNQSINDIDPSKVFLLDVSCRSSKLQWLEKNENAYRSSISYMMESVGRPISPNYMNGVGNQNMMYPSASLNQQFLSGYNIHSTQNMPLANENHHIPRHPGIHENNVSRNHNPWDPRYFQREQAFDNNQDYYSARPDDVPHYNASNTYQQTTFQDRRAFDQSYRRRQDNEDHYYYQGCHDYSSSSHYS